MCSDHVCKARPAPPYTAAPTPPQHRSAARPPGRGEGRGTQRRRERRGAARLRRTGRPGRWGEQDTREILVVAHPEAVAPAPEQVLPEDAVVALHILQPVVHLAGAERARLVGQLEGGARPGGCPQGLEQLRRR